MAHEELQKQFEKDCETHEKPWELWEYQELKRSWRGCYSPGPEWRASANYRRKEPPFEPEYFSGLNWRDAERLVGKLVEFSCNGDGWNTGILEYIDKKDFAEFRFGEQTGVLYTYIRTCPETHAHPTITIGGVELPRPEVEAPKYDQTYYTFDCNEKNRTFAHSWCDDSYDKMWLNHGIVHLTEDRAQAWASWWENTVMAAVRGGE
jgi:hypothetical protein